MLVRNGLDYLTAVEIVFKIYKGQAISILHSSVNKHLNVHSPAITETVQIVKKGKKEQRIKQTNLKRGFSITVKEH